MTNTDVIKSIYAKKLPRRYSKSYLFNSFKRRAIEDSSLQAGDTVMVFCCGPGTDFPHIMDKIGESGKIMAMDFSDVMLEQAGELALQHGWKNVELFRADATTFDYNACVAGKTDAGVCTLGLSIIPEYTKAFYNLFHAVKENGEIIVGDMQSAKGIWSLFNPLTLAVARPYGGTKEGHENSHKVYELMQKECHDVSKNELFFRGYYYALGVYWQCHDVFNRVFIYLEGILDNVRS